MRIFAKRIMDLQTRKLKAIEYLIGLKDEQMFRKIESSIIEIQKEESTHATMHPFTVGELVDRAHQSNIDYLSVHFKSQEELEQDSENHYK